MTLRPALLLLAVSSLAACTIGVETDEATRGHESLVTMPTVSLTVAPPPGPTILPPLLMLPPAWALDRCEGGATPSRYFVRVNPVAHHCPDVGTAPNVWIGTRVFNDKSGYCSYRWGGTSTPQYSALEPMAKDFPNNDPVFPATVQGIVADCMPTPSACIIADGAPSSGPCLQRFQDDGPENPGPLKGINPCGACGFTAGSWTKVIVPWNWVWSEVTVVPWEGSRYLPNGQQAFWVYNRSYSHLTEARDANVRRL